MEAKCNDRDVGYDEWPNVVTVGIPVKPRGQKNDSAWVSCSHVIFRNIARKEGEGPR